MVIVGLARESGSTRTLAADGSGGDSMQGPNHQSRAGNGDVLLLEDKGSFQLHSPHPVNLMHFIEPRNL